jgi:hypothetical protein
VNTPSSTVPVRILVQVADHPPQEVGIAHVTVTDQQEPIARLLEELSVHWRRPEDPE